MSARTFAPRYVILNAPPGRLGVAWWVASVLLLVDLPAGLLLGETTIGWWTFPAGLLSWAAYSTWRVATTRIWQSPIAAATIGRWIFRDYPTDEDIAAGAYLDAGR